MKDIDIYLPIRQRMQLTEVAWTMIPYSKSLRIPNSKPFVLYGCRLPKGLSSARPHSYAGSSRNNSVYYVNLGFGGNGKAEPEVVSGFRNRCLLPY